MDFDEVHTDLFLGSRRGVHDFLSSQNSSSISVLTVESENLSPLPQEVAQHKFIQVNDVETADLLSHFDDMVTFIKNGLLEGLVYVHCRHGISRSAAACAAFLMSQCGVDADEAVERLRRCRPCVSPNEGFRRQLRLYGQLGCGTSLRHPRFRQYRLRTAGRDIGADGSVLPAVSTPLLLPDEGLVSASVATYRCGQCRTGLFSERSLLPSDDPEWTGCLQPGGGVQPAPPVGSYRLLPLPWMQQVTQHTHGKLTCPRCRRKLGCFSWLPDFQRMPDDSFEPVFLITRSRVDRCLPTVATSTGTGHLVERHSTATVAPGDR